MKKHVFIIALLLFAGFAFSQTLTPEVCWTFDGKDTDMKKIHLNEDAPNEKILEIWQPTIERMKVKNHIEIGFSDINQTIALIDGNNRWIIFPTNSSEVIEKMDNYESLKKVYLLLTQMLFVISIHESNISLPFKDPMEVIRIDENIINLMLIKEDSHRFSMKELDFLLQGYKSLSDSPTQHYPTKEERVSKLLFRFLAIQDSLAELKFDKRHYPEQAAQQKAIADSIAAVEALYKEETRASRTKTKIKCTPYNYDFGKVNEGEKLIYTFFVKNIGKNDLYVDEVYSDYNSVETDFCIDKAIRPEETCRLNVYWTPIFDEIGNTKKQIRLKGNFEGEQIITISAQVAIDSVEAAERERVEREFNTPNDEAQTLADSLPKTQVEWVEDIYDFKQINEGEKPHHSFQVKNVGNYDLHITKVKPSCGCTATYCTKEIIKPGEMCQVYVEFNSAGKSGTQQKSITVTGNFEGGTQKVLRFTGEVKGKHK